MQLVKKSILANFSEQYLDYNYELDKILGTERVIHMIRKYCYEEVFKGRVPNPFFFLTSGKFHLLYTIKNNESIMSNEENCDH